VAHRTISSPVGPLALEARDGALVALRFGAGPPDAGEDPVLDAATAQLRAYFAGELQAFELPLAPRGTPFQQEVWAALRRVPFGATTTYGELAARLATPRGPAAARAVGAANGANPLSIVVPCHRVVGARGALVGFAGGLETKRRLLAHEGALLL
jgi:methylated-DNA-[protein]-cysteine S-methyltransferase